MKSYHNAQFARLTEKGKLKPTLAQRRAQGEAYRAAILRFGAPEPEAAPGPVVQEAAPRGTSFRDAAGVFDHDPLNIVRVYSGGAQPRLVARFTASRVSRTEDHEHCVVYLDIYTDPDPNGIADADSDAHADADTDRDAVQDMDAAPDVDGAPDTDGDAFFANTIGYIATHLAARIRAENTWRNWFRWHIRRCLGLWPR